MFDTVTWTTKGQRTVAHDSEGRAVAIIYKDAPASYSVQRAVTWPGGARDWTALGTVPTLTAGKKLAAV